MSANGLVTSTGLVRSSAKTLWILAGAGFRRFSTYRLATVAGLATNSTFGLIRASIMLAAITSAGTTIAGYDADQASSFVWWSQGLIASIGLFGWNDVAVRVKSGDIAVDFARPIDPQLAYLATDLGRAAFLFVARGLPSVLIGAVTFGIALPRSPWLWPVGLLSTVLAVVVSFACRYAVNVTSFWIVENRGPQMVYTVLSGFLCGLFLPVHWFPDWLQTVAHLTPFPSMLQSPLDMLSGQASLAEAWPLLAVQVFWAVVVLGLGQVLTRLGRRKLEVQGG